jgi:hypothetical protein
MSDELESGNAAMPLDLNGFYQQQEEVEKEKASSQIETADASLSETAPPTSVSSSLVQRLLKLGKLGEKLQQLLSVWSFLLFVPLFFAYDMARDSRHIARIPVVRKLFVTQAPTADFTVALVPFTTNEASGLNVQQLRARAQEALTERLTSLEAVVGNINFIELSQSFSVEDQEYKGQWLLDASGADLLIAADVEQQGSKEPLYKLWIIDREGQSLRQARHKFREIQGESTTFKFTTEGQAYFDKALIAGITVRVVERLSSVNLTGKLPDLAPILEDGGKG